MRDAAVKKSVITKKVNRSVKPLYSMSGEPTGNVVCQGERRNAKTPGGLKEAKAMFM